MTMSGVESGAEPECLVVDDMVHNLFCLQLTLNGVGVVSIGQTNGYDAVKLVKERIALQLSSGGLTRPFQFIVLDYQMPGMDGAETASLIL